MLYLLNKKAYFTKKYALVSMISLAVTSCGGSEHSNGGAISKNASSMN